MRFRIALVPLLGILSSVASASDRPVHQLVLQGSIDPGTALGVRSRYVAKSSFCRHVLRKHPKQFTSVAKPADTPQPYRISVPLDWGDSGICKYRLESVALAFGITGTNPAPEALVIPLERSRTRANPVQGIDGTTFVCQAAQGKVQCVDATARVQLTSLDLPESPDADLLLQLNVQNTAARAPEPPAATGDLGYRYDSSARACLKNGQLGHNPEWAGECGELSGKDLHDANLRGASLRGLRILGTNLSNADLTGADLSGATLYGCNLTQANLTGAKLVGAMARKDDLTDANLSNADLSSANLADSILERAHLLGAKFSGAILTGAHLDGALFHLTHLDGAALDGASLRNADLSTSELGRGAELQGADLSGADLRNLSLEKARLASARLQGTHLQGADLTNADLESADLSGADLTGSKVEGTRFVKARYDANSKLPFDENRAKALGMVETLTPPPPPGDGS